MMKKILLLTLIIVLAGALFMVFREGGKRDVDHGKINTFTDRSLEKGLIEIKGFHHMERSEGHRDTDIYAERAFYRQGETSAFLEKPHVKVFLGDRKILSFGADSAEIDIRKRDVTLEGNIRIQTDTGYALETHSLKYYWKHHKITTSNKIQIHGPDMDLESLGLIADLDKRQLRLADASGKTITLEGGNSFTAAVKLLGVYEKLLEDFRRQLIEKPKARI